MDYTAVPAPTNYGAPNVFQQQGQQGQNGQQGQQQQNPLSAALQKAKQLLSQGTISADQYNQLASQAQSAGAGSLPYSGGNMGAGMPQAAGQAAGAPMNILPTG